MAAEFRAIHEEQKRLTKGLEELSREIMAGDMRNAARLDGLANRQQQVLDRWKAWHKELRDAAEALPGKYQEFKAEALDFASRAGDAGIQLSMERAMERAKKVNTPDTFVNSQLALAGMDSLLTAGDRMCRACDGSQPHFQFSMEGMNQTMAQTLAQMLSGMGRRHGFPQSPESPGAANAAGPGIGGDSGYAMLGDPIMQSPVYGPGRMTFSGDSSLRGEARGNGSGNSRSPMVQRDATASIEPNASRTDARRQLSLRDVPERYRDAVRRFYGEESVRETSNNSKR